MATATTSKSNKKSIRYLKDRIHNACQTLGISDRGSLPIGGKYPHAIYTKPVTIRGHSFGAIVFQPEDKHTLAIYVVEELPKERGSKIKTYRMVDIRSMSFLDGKVESFWEMLDWGYYTDGYGVMLEGFEDSIIRYMKKFPSDYESLGALEFDNMTEALDYYSAWQTEKEAKTLAKETRKMLRYLNGDNKRTKKAMGNP